MYAFSAVLLWVLFNLDPQNQIIIRVYGGFRDIILKGIVLYLLIFTTSGGMLALIFIFGFTAVKAENVRVKARSAFISFGGAMFATSGIIDFAAISITSDILLLIFARMFSLVTLIVMFLGFHYPKWVENLILKLLYKHSIN